MAEHASKPERNVGGEGSRGMGKTKCSGSEMALKNAKMYFKEGRQEDLFN